MSEAADGRDLDALVTEWLDWAATAKALGVSVNQVRTMIREHQLAAAVPTGSGGPAGPGGLRPRRRDRQGPPGAADDLPRRRLGRPRGASSGSSPTPSSRAGPIDALRENRGAEVKRRAQALAF